MHNLNDFDHFIIPPDPKRMVEGLRDTGYSFDTAIADIVDNSIMADATTVKIDIEQDPIGEVLVFIVDNGTGMNIEELKNAVKYGSDRQANPKSLSKFGLGLKTGSTAFCKRLSIISKRSETTLQRATWDLDKIQDEWRVERAKGTPEQERMISEISADNSGTIIMWENVDRLIKNYVDPLGGHAQNALKKLEDGLINHLSMVFQRFLDKEDERAPFLKIEVNGKSVDPWDPFCLWHPETRVTEKEVPVEMGGKDVSFMVRSCIIPRTQEFETDEEVKKANIKTNNQGIYVYRENRLICGPDWLNIYSREPHMNLLRVEFSFDHDMDEAFNVDIKKSRISLNSALYDFFEKFLTPQRRAANERYRKGIKTIVTAKSKDGHAESNRGIGAKEATSRSSQSEVEDPEKNEVKVTNKQGTFVIKMPVNKPYKEGQLVVQPVASIDDGLLWQPCQVHTEESTHHGVQINTGHPYYMKVYVPNLKSGVTVQGMDSLLWALCEAERSVVNPDIQKQLDTLKYEVSRILRSLVEDLPEPEINED